MTHVILLVEDDDKLGGEVARLLRENDFEVEWLQDGSSAQWVDVVEYDLVILDLMLPGAYGFDLLKEYRKHSDIPVIILTARKDTFDKIRSCISFTLLIFSSSSIHLFRSERIVDN